MSAMPYQVRILAIFMAAASLQGCLLPENFGDAEQSVILFHERLNSESYEKIFELTAPAFQDQQVRDEALVLFSAMHSRLGPALESEEIDASFYASGDGGETVTLVYQTTFEHGSATETFVFSVETGKPLIWNYNISSETFTGADVSDHQRLAENAT